MTPVSGVDIPTVMGEKTLFKAESLVWPSISSGEEHWFLTNANPALPGNTVLLDAANVPGGNSPTCWHEVDVSGADLLRLEGGFTIEASGGMASLSSDNLRVIAMGFTTWDPDSSNVLGQLPIDMRRNVTFAQLDSRCSGLSVAVVGQNNTGTTVVFQRANVAANVVLFAVLNPTLAANDSVRWRVQVGERAKGPGTVEATPFTDAVRVTQLKKVFLAMRHVTVVTTPGAPTLSGEIRAITSKIG